MAKQQSKGLGRGLGALIEQASTETGVTELDVKSIKRNENQPRTTFDEQGIAELSDSIREHGVIQPIIVTEENGFYKIVAGERRYRASIAAGLKTIPAIIKSFDEEELMQVALIENLQREDLNPIEEAGAYRTLCERFGYTQEELSKKIGKSRTAIANSLRLLSLDDNIRDMISSDTISAGHARAILSLTDETLRPSFAKYISEKHLSVREAEREAKTFSGENKPSAAKKPNIKKEKSHYVSEIEDNLQTTLGTKVSLNDKNGRGELVIEYYTADDLERIIDIITGR